MNTRLRAWLCGFAAGLASLSSQAATLPLGITNQPQSLVLYECQLAKFTVGFTGTLGLMSWYRDGVFTTHSASYSVPNRVTLSDDGSQVFVVLSNSLGSVTSSIATLTVTADPLPFRVAAVKSCSGLNQLLVSFATCPLVATNATNVLNYSLDGGAVVSNAAVNLSTNVLLTTSPLVSGASYTLTVTNIKDSKGNFLSPNPTQISFVAGAETGLTITMQPVGASVEWTQPLTLQFVVQAISTCFGTNAPVVYQWQKRYVTNSFANIPGETNSAYFFYAQTAFCWGGDLEYRALAFANGLVVTSSTAVVQVYLEDAYPPGIESATCSTLAPNLVSLKFHELVSPVGRASATNVALYSINNGVTILSANYGSNRFGTNYYEIVLTTTPLTNGAYYVAGTTNVQGGCEFPPEYLAFPHRVPIALLGPHQTAGHDYIYIEAEDYDANIFPGGGLWWRQPYNYSDPTVSGSYMEGSPAGTYPQPFAVQTNSWHLDYSVDFPSAGVWYVWLRGKNEGTFRSGIWAGLNGVPTTLVGSVANGWNGTNWLWTSSAENSDRASITVTNSGSHQFSLWAHPYTSSTFIDSILLTTNEALDIAPRSRIWSNEVNCVSVPNPKPDVCLWPPPREPTLDLRVIARRVGTNWELSWPAGGGVLQETTNVTPIGPYYHTRWEDVTNAVSPFVISNGTSRFYRVKFFSY